MWYFFDDNKVTEYQDYTSYIHQNAYILLYEQDPHNQITHPSNNTSLPTPNPSTFPQIPNLRNTQWLNDETINTYIQLLQSHADNRCGSHRIHFFTSFFYTKLALSPDFSYSNVKNWKSIRNIDIFQLDKLVFPIHYETNHWILVLIELGQNKIHVYDSYHGAHTEIFQEFRNYLQLHHMHTKQGQQFRITDWTNIDHSDIPKQTNGYDCGVFTLQYAHCIANDQHITCDQQETSLLRQRISNEIIYGYRHSN